MLFCVFSDPRQRYKTSHRSKDKAVFTGPPPPYRVVYFLLDLPPPSPRLPVLSVGPLRARRRHCEKRWRPIRKRRRRRTPARVEVLSPRRYSSSYVGGERHLAACLSVRLSLSPADEYSVCLARGLSSFQACYVYVRAHTSSCRSLKPRVFCFRVRMHVACDCFCFSCRFFLFFFGCHVLFLGGFEPAPLHGELFCMPSDTMGDVM